MGNPRALVTGAGGFIGSHLVERLVHDGWDVRGVVRYTSRGHDGWLAELAPDLRASVELLSGNIEDPAGMTMAAQGCDAVFHLAALIGIPYSYRAPQQYVASNVVGTLNVLEAARTAGCRRVVVVSTSEVYGTARYTPIDEQHPLHAQSPYAATKIAAEKLAESYALSFDVPVTVVRPFNTYGPRQSRRAVIPTIIVQCLAGREIRLGSLEPIRDFSYVLDTVDGMVAAADRATTPGQVFNIGAGEAVTIGELVATIQRLVGSALPVVTEDTRIRPPRSEVLELRCDNRRAGAELGWRPRHHLEEGLRETIEWFRRHRVDERADEYAI